MKIFISTLLFINIIAAQPDSRFGTFDWTLYRQVGSINSVSEGYNFAYFATENAGILRFHLYQKQFVEPITIAQGLSENQILAIHYDKSTGILWTASENYINYSYNAEGNWFSIKIEDTGLQTKARIEQIGSSNNFIWISTRNTYVKLGKVSGIVMGLQPFPDDFDIAWSSKRERFIELPNSLKNYILLDGWMRNNTEFIDPYGNLVQPTTFFFGDNNSSYIGLEDGTIFYGDTQMDTFYPYNHGLNNSDIFAFTKRKDLWIVGRETYASEGVTRYNIKNNDFQHINFKSEINFNQKSFYSALEIDNEIWLGGESIISIYNKKDDYWREIDEGKGLPNAKILAMVEDSASVWVGSTRGLYKVSKITKRVEKNDIDKYLKLNRINDLDLIDGILWIATNLKLLIYDQKINSLFDFKKYGNTDNISKRKGIFTNFTDVYKLNDNVYISTSVGILKFNIIDATWTIAVEPSAYAGSKVNKIVITDNYCFAGTDDGIWQIILEDGSSQLYNFPFIGSVHDMYIHNDTLLIGSNNGLIKYLWN